MLVSMRSVLDSARSEGSAIACINTPSPDLVRGVVRAAEDLRRPVIIAHAEVHDAKSPVEYIGPIMVESARKATVPVAVHVDHGYTPGFVLRCLRTGFTSAMLDMSAKPYDENLHGSSRFADFMHQAGVSVESEVGVMGTSAEDSHGKLDDAPVDSTASLTDPDVAAEFARSTHVDALAVCFGTVHGMYSAEPHIDLERLSAIRAAVPSETALVMHGSSGLSLELLTAATRAGVSKVNYYTYLSVDATEFAAQFVRDSNYRVYYHDLSEAVVEHVTAHARKVMLALVP